MSRRMAHRGWLLLAAAAWLAGPVATPVAAQARAGGWERASELILPVRAAVVGTDGERIFVFAGTTDANAKTAYTQIFDPETNAWTLGADAPERFDWSSLVLARGVFHLMGGRTDREAATNHHWIYDPVEDSWTEGPAMLSAAAGAAAALVDDRILVIGGIDGPAAYSARVRVLDLESGRWSERASAPSARINWQGAVLEGAFFVAGGSGPGRNTGSALYRYNPMSDQWTAHALAAAPTEGYAGTLANGRYCVLGGRVTPRGGSLGPPSNRVDCYEPVADRWLALPRLPRAIQEAGAAAVGGYLYSIGGRIPTGPGVTAEVYRLRL